MSLSTPQARFLLDENVRVELARFLQTRDVNVKLAPKGASDALLANISKREKRVFVTNDKDFFLMDKNRTFGVVWLRVPQKDVGALFSSFHILLNECRIFSNRLIILGENGWSMHTKRNNEL